MVITARLTVCHVQVQSLQLSGEDRRDLAPRSEVVVCGEAVLEARAVHRRALAA